MAQFEETFIHSLAMTKAEAMLRRGLSTLLAYITPGAQEGRILHLVGQVKTRIRSMSNFQC